MKALTRILFGLAVAVLVITGKRDAAAQCATPCPVSTSVVAFQPVVVPTSPAMISGWYPGRLLDTWAANRSAFRSATMTAPVATSVPVTSFRPMTGVVFQSTSMPVRTFRPLFGSPIVATTAFQPIVTSSSACCSTCAATVTSFPATSACCGTTVSDGSYYGDVTPIPTIPANEPTRANYPGDPPNPAHADGGEGENPNEQSVKEEDPAGAPESDTGPASFEPPLLRDPRMQAQPSNGDRNVARNDTTAITEAVYKEAVRPRLATTSARTSNTQAPAKPSRAEREAMWTAVTD